MYRPAANIVDETTGWDLLAAMHVGHLVTTASGALDATFLPFMVDVEERRVRVHVARANGQWRDASGAAGLLIASGADAYVSPSYYATKRETGEVVPTWNYTTVHAHGTLRVHHDPEWLRDLVGQLTDLHERARPAPWTISDAPTDYVDRQLRSIVGIELTVDRLEAKQKLSQNRSPEDFAGVVSGLDRGHAGERAVAADMKSIEVDRSR